MFGFDASFVFVHALPPFVPLRLALGCNCNCNCSSFASSAANANVASTRNIIGNATPTNPRERGNSLVYVPNATCDDVWMSWPAVQERAIADGTVLVFDTSQAVGNLFLAFERMMKVCSCDSRERTTNRALTVFLLALNLN